MPTGSSYNQVNVSFALLAIGSIMLVVHVYAHKLVQANIDKCTCTRLAI